jgi:Flp pilus assembly protein TadG
VVEFVVVVPMLMLLVLATAQVALALHVRSTVTSAAAEGARVAAAAGADPVLARRRIASALAGSLAQGVVDSVTVRRVVRGGIAMVQVEVVSTLPLVGLLGPTSMVVQGHAVSEG